MNHLTRIGLVLGLIALGGVRPAVAQGAAPSAAVIAKGDSIFHGPGMCYACHGSKAEGMVGPNLTDAEWKHGSTDAELFKIVKEGIAPFDGMKPLAGRLSDTEIWQVIHYVRSLSKSAKK